MSKIKMIFLDSYDKIYIRRKLLDACKDAIQEYEENESMLSPILKLSKNIGGGWDTRITDNSFDTKEIKLTSYTNENDELDFERVLRDSMKFLDEEELTEEDAEEEDVEEELEEELTEEDGEEDTQEEELTYKDYIGKEYVELPEKDFRRTLIDILLKNNKGWAYIREPKKIKGDEFDIVTRKNAKKIMKSLKE